MRLADLAEHLLEVGAGEGVVGREEERQAVGRKVPEGAAVRVLRARLRLRQDLLAPGGVGRAGRAGGARERRVSVRRSAVRPGQGVRGGTHDFGA